jgi:hypothetical protein
MPNIALDTACAWTLLHSHRHNQLCKESTRCAVHLPDHRSYANWDRVSKRIHHITCNKCYALDAGVANAAHRTSAVDTCYIGEHKLAGLWRQFRVRRIRSLPWLTFLRFFEVFTGASELVAGALFFEGELLLGALASVATLFRSASLPSVILTEDAPLDCRAASVIKDDQADGCQNRVLFLELRGLMCATTGIRHAWETPNRATDLSQRYKHVLWWYSGQLVER